MERTTPPPWTLQSNEGVLLCSLALCFWSGVYCVAVNFGGCKMFTQITARPSEESLCFSHVLSTCHFLVVRRHFLLRQWWEATADVWGAGVGVGCCTVKHTMVAAQVWIRHFMAQLSSVLIASLAPSHVRDWHITSSNLAGCQRQIPQHMSTIFVNLYICNCSTLSKGLWTRST